MTGLPAVRDLGELRAAVRGWRQQGLTIAFVPTMGALHAGHLALVEHGLARCDRVVVSIFVNPTQFAPGEDLERYPRDEAADLDRLARMGAHLAWLPPRELMYAADAQTWVEVEELARGLESLRRPHFFKGVATVVTKLLNQVQADLAVFGEKDYQQLLVVRQLARDLAIATEIEGRPTVREADGLALSSRNIYLSAVERALAPALHRALVGLARDLADGGTAPTLLAAARDDLVAAGFAEVDYLELRDAATLAPLQQVGERPARLLAAARLGGVRLIDNLPVPRPDGPARAVAPRQRLVFHRC